MCSTSTEPIPNAAVDFDESPEGHHRRYDNAGRLIGLTIVRPRRLLESEGAVAITLPKQVHVRADALRQALAAA